MTELAVRNGHSGEVAVPLPAGAVASLAQWAQEARAAGALAESLCKTSFVPEHFRGKPAEATAAILTGHELGMSPMASLRSIFVIKGTPGMYANAMRAVVQSHGHDVWVEEQTQTRAIVCGRRKGTNEVVRVVWDTSRAKLAELTGNAQYRKNPQNMFVARGTAEVCRQIAADALHGIPYAVEELDDEFVAVEEKPAAAAKSRKMSRAQAEPAPEPQLDAPAPSEEMINPEQMSLLQVLFKEKGILDRDERLRQAAVVVNRQLGSANELTKAEAHQVIDWLKAPVVEAEPAVTEPSFDDDAWLGGQAETQS